MVSFIIVVIGDPKYEATEPEVGLQELRHLLASEEISEAISKPLKETVSAGKSLLSLGQRFSNWMGKLIRTN